MLLSVLTDVTVIIIMYVTVIRIAVIAGVTVTITVYVTAFSY